MLSDFEDDEDEEDEDEEDEEELCRSAVDDKVAPAESKQ